jgi:hypothetical protein
MKNRFCYNYKAPGFVQPCCKPVVAATNAYLSSISCGSGMISGQTQSALLQLKQEACIGSQWSTLMSSTIQSTIQNSNAISAQVYAQLLDVNKRRYEPYQPYIYPVIPSSVIQLQMATANVGVPMSVITCLSGKGNQYITT